MRGPWTDEDHANLRLRVSSGENVPQIAKAMGRTQEATRNRMQKLGLTAKRPTGATGSLSDDDGS
jgi:hypothetical protein